MFIKQRVHWQSQRNLKMRSKRHLSAFKNKHTEKSNFAKHLSENGHNPTLESNNSLVLWILIQTNFLEVLEIQK